MKRSCVLLLAAFLLFPVSAFSWSAGGGVGIVSPITIDLAFQNNIGPEKITNGAMGAATGWTVGADWTIGGGLATKAAGGASTLAQASTAMVTPLVVGEVYLLVYTLDTTVTTGGLTPSAGGWTGTNQTADGTYREYFRASSTGALTFTPGNANLTCTLDNVSLKKVATQAADQVALWVEDQGGTATKAGLYVRGEDGGVIGLAGEVFSFGSLDGDMTLTHSSNALTLAGGQLILPKGLTTAVALGFDSVVGMYQSTGNSFWFQVASGERILRISDLESTYGVTLAAGRHLGWATDTAENTAADLLLSREGPAVMQMGADSATPAPQAIKGPDGVGSNIAGGDLAVDTGLGTGTGTPGRGYLHATVQTGAGSGAQTLAEVASWGSSNGVDRGLRYLTDIISQGGAGADTTESVRNGYIRVTAAATRTLPAGTIVGQTVNYVSTTAAVVSVDVASGSDYIILNGTALAAGFKATSDGTVGAMLTCVNDVANYWRCQAVQGVWSDGGA